MLQECVQTLQIIFPSYRPILSCWPPQPPRVQCSGKGIVDSLPDSQAIANAAQHIETKSPNGRLDSEIITSYSFSQNHGIPWLWEEGQSAWGRNCSAHAGRECWWSISSCLVRWDATRRFKLSNLWILKVLHSQQWCQPLCSENGTAN